MAIEVELHLNLYRLIPLLYKLIQSIEKNKQKDGKHSNPFKDVSIILKPKPKLHSGFQKLEAYGLNLTCEHVLFGLYKVLSVEIV